MDSHMIRNVTEPQILDSAALAAYAAEYGLTPKERVGVGFVDAQGDISIWYGSTWQELVHDFSDILKAVQERADEEHA